MFAKVLTYSPQKRAGRRRCVNTSSDPRPPQPDAFDYAMDAIEPGNDEPGATGEAEPVCAFCEAKIGIFLDCGLAWQHCNGDGTTVGQQHIYDPGHAPVVTWRFSKELQSHD